MRYLVTGAAGFIGAAVSDALMLRGDQVVGIDNLNDYYPVSLKLARRDRLMQLHADRFTFLKIDFADYRSLVSVLEGEQFGRIVHLGAQPGVRYSLENPRAYIEANLMGHLNLLELARDRRVDHMVYASSSSVYGNASKVPFSVDDPVDRGGPPGLQGGGAVDGTWMDRTRR